MRFWVKRTAEIVLFVGGVAAVSLGWPWGLCGFAALFAWYWLWHARPIPDEACRPPDRKA